MLPVSAEASNTHDTALLASRRTVNARANWQGAHTPFTLQESGGAVDPRTGDIGRAALRRVGDDEYTWQVRHVTGGFSVGYWTGAATPSGRSTLAAPSWGDRHSSALYLYSDGNAYTSTAYGSTLHLYQITPAMSLSSAATVAMPITLSGDHWSACQIINNYELFFCLVEAHRIRLWRVTSTGAMWSGTVTWEQAPLVLAPRHDQDAFLASAQDADGTARAFDWRTANGFDALEWGSLRLVLAQDHQLGRPVLIRRSQAGVWSNPKPVLPLDLIDDASRLHLCRLSLIDTRLALTGRMARPGSDTPLEFDACLWSDDARWWQIGRRAWLCDEAVYGTLLGYEDGRECYLGSQSAYTAYPTGGGSAPVHFFSLARGSESAPMLEVELPARPGGTALLPPASGDRLTLEAGYNGLFLNMGAFLVDRVSHATRDGQARYLVQGREEDASRLLDWQPPHTLDQWTQSRLASDFRRGGHHYTVAGAPRHAAYQATVAADWHAGAGEMLALAHLPSDTTPAEPGDLLWQMDGTQVTQLLRVNAAGVVDEAAGLTRYPVTRLIGSGTLLAGEALAARSLMLGDAGRTDIAALALPRGFEGQIGQAELQFTAHPWTYGEQASLRMHYAGERGAWDVTFQKVSGGFDWSLGVIVDGAASEQASGHFAVSTAERRLWLRWRVGRGGGVVWYSWDGLTFSELGTLGATGLVAASEGGLALVGSASGLPTSLLDWSVIGRTEGVAARLGSHVPLAAPAPAEFPPYGWVALGDIRAYYQSLNRTPSRAVAFHDTDRGHWFDTNDANAHELRDMLCDLTLYDQAGSQIGTYATYVRDVQPSPNGGWRLYFDQSLDGEQWGLGPEFIPYMNQAAWSMNGTFWPTLRLSPTTPLEWTRHAGGAPIRLAPSPDETPAGIAVHAVQVADLLPDLTLAEAVSGIAQMAGSLVLADQVAPDAWPARSGWTVTPGHDPHESVRLDASAAGTYQSAFYFFEGVIRCQMEVGTGAELRLINEALGKSWTVRLAAGRIELFHEAELIYHTPYQHGAGAGRCTLRLSVKWDHVCLWIDEYAALYYTLPYERRWRYLRKRLDLYLPAAGYISYLDIPEAYECAEVFLIDQYAPALQSISRLVGQRRAALLYRATRPIRFGTMERREQYSGALGRVLTLGHENDESSVHTLVQVQGAHHRAEVLEGTESYGLRAVQHHRPELTTRDACIREARLLARHSREGSERLRVAVTPNLLLEREDVLTLDIGDGKGPREWVVEAIAPTTFAHDAARSELRFHQELALRRYEGS